MAKAGIVPGRTSLIIATTPRSGSWLIAEGLRQLGVAGRPEEYFWREMEPLYVRQWALRQPPSDAEFLARVLSEGTTPNGVFAAKVHWFQLVQLVERLRRLAQTDPCEDDRALLEHYFGTTHFVYLRRTNITSQAVSWHRALVTDVWWRVDGEHDPRPDDPGPFDFHSVRHLKYLLEDYNCNWEDWFQRVGVSPLRVAYEELSHDYERVIRTILGHLGVECPATVSAPRLQKQADAVTRRWLRSYAAAQRDYLTVD